MIWGSEHILFRYLISQFFGKDLLFKVSGRSNFGYLEGYTLVHHFCGQIVPFDLLLVISGEKFDWIRVGEIRKVFSFILSKILFLTVNLIINDHCR